MTPHAIAAAALLNSSKKRISQEQLDRVHAPIGLPIATEAPEEIAVSIMAEIIQIKQGSNQK